MRLAESNIFWEGHVGDDRVVVNAAANNLIGGNKGSIDRNIGWWLDRVHPDDHLSLKAASKNAFERREAEWTANFRLKTSRGRYIPVLLRGFHVYAASGNLERIIATEIDLSVVKEAEAKAKNLQDELVHVSSVSVIGRAACRERECENV